jgi:hypothetical protein
LLLILVILTKAITALPPTMPKIFKRLFLSDKDSIITAVVALE